MTKDQIHKLFNAAINFALEDAGPEGLTFLSMWWEGQWDEIDDEFPAFDTKEARKLCG